MCKCEQGLSCICKPETKLVPHVHAALIKAWADGEVIQYGYRGIWQDVVSPQPLWALSLEYRIKPTPKPDVVLYGNLAERFKPPVLPEIFSRLFGRLGPMQIYTDNIKVVYDGETGVLKSVEMIK